MQYAVTLVTSGDVGDTVRSTSVADESEVFFFATHLLCAPKEIL